MLSGSDHFRGFAGYYEIPFGSPTAEQGKWVTGPGKNFFKTLSPALEWTGKVGHCRSLPRISV